VDVNPLGGGGRPPRIRDTPSGTLYVPVVAYARFGSDDSDVYVFLATSGHLECCACLLGDKWDFHTTDEMLGHLDEHRAAGHCVPQGCIDALVEDKAENDQWIARYDPAEERRKHDEANRRRKEIWKIAEQELGYVHPGPEKFDAPEYFAAWEQASQIYEERASS